MVQSKSLSSLFVYATILVIALLVGTIAANGLKGSETIHIHEDRKLWYPFTTWEEFWRFLLCFWNFGLLFDCPPKP
jgi:hypothetical protein